MSAPTTLCIDWLGRPLLINALLKMHPRVQHRAKQPWREAGAAAAGIARLGHHERVTVTVQARYRTAQMCDTDACSPALKAVLDGLVDAGVIPDDGPKHVASVTYLAPQMDRGLPDALLVKVEAA